MEDESHVTAMSLSLSKANKSQNEKNILKSYLLQVTLAKSYKAIQFFSSKTSNYIDFRPLVTHEECVVAVYTPATFDWGYRKSVYCESKHFRYELIKLICL